MSIHGNPEHVEWNSNRGSPPELLVEKPNMRLNLVDALPLTIPMNAFSGKIDDVSF